MHDQVASLITYLEVVGFNQISLQQKISALKRKPKFDHDVLFQCLDRARQGCVTQPVLKKFLSERYIEASVAELDYFFKVVGGNRHRFNRTDWANFLGVQAKHYKPSKNVVSQQIQNSMLALVFQVLYNNRRLSSQITNHPIRDPEKLFRLIAGAESYISKLRMTEFLQIYLNSNQELISAILKTFCRKQLRFCDFAQNLSLSENKEVKQNILVTNQSEMYKQVVPRILKHTPKYPSDITKYGSSTRTTKKADWDEAYQLIYTDNHHRVLTNLVQQILSTPSDSTVQVSSNKSMHKGFKVSNGHKNHFGNNSAKILCSRPSSSNFKTEFDQSSQAFEKQSILDYQDQYGESIRIKRISSRRMIVPDLATFASDCRHEQNRQTLETDRSQMYDVIEQSIILSPPQSRYCMLEPVSTPKKDKLSHFLQQMSTYPHSPQTHNNSFMEAGKKGTGTSNLGTSKFNNSLPQTPQMQANYHSKWNNF